MRRIRLLLPTLIFIALIPAFTGRVGAAPPVAPASAPVAETNDDVALPVPTSPESVGLDPRLSFDRDLAAATLDKVTELLYEVTPDRLAGSEVIDAGGIVFVKGELPAAVAELIAGLPVPVVAVESLPYGFEELNELAWDVNQAALAVPGVESAVSYSPPLARGTVTLVVELAPGLSGTSVLRALPESIQSVVDVRVSGSERALVYPESSFGGMRISSGSSICTSGFTVQPADGGNKGILTAGHCSSMNQISHPGDGTHSMTFQDEHVGSYGDFEWHETNVTEAAKFYASSSTIRDVNSVQAASNVSVGDPVCGYGRSSSFAPVCGEVAQTGAACSGTGRLVLTNLYDDPLIGGDSGGPWYRQQKAWGVHRGNCNFVESFSLVDYADEAVYASVAIAP